MQVHANSYLERPSSRKEEQQTHLHGEEDAACGHLCPVSLDVITVQRMAGNRVAVLGKCMCLDGMSNVKFTGCSREHQGVVDWEGQLHMAKMARAVASLPTGGTTAAQEGLSVLLQVVSNFL